MLERRRRTVGGQALAEYVVLTGFVVIGLLLVMTEFEEVLIRLYANAVNLIFSTFP